MVLVIVTVVILFGAIFLGMEMHDDPGHVQVVFNGWQIQTEFWVAAIIVAVAFLAFYIVLRLLDRTLNMRGKVRDWAEDRKERKLMQLTSHGLLELAEANWQSAEQNLVKAAQEGQNPLLNYLGAARAAQAQGATDRRDMYLRKAIMLGEGTEVAVGMTQVELQIQSQQWQQALTTLHHLRDIAPKHPHVMKLLVDIYQRVDDWDAIQKLLPHIAKHKALPENVQSDLLQQAAIAQLDIAGRAIDESELASAWNALSRSLRQQPEITLVYVKHLIARQQYDEAASLIEQQLKKNWRPEWLEFYSQLQGRKLSKRISHAESWLKDRPRDSVLLVCLGKLCQHEALWGKARDYYQAALAVAPDAEIYQRLGEVLEELDEKDAALESYRKASHLQSAIKINNFEKR